MFSPIVNEKPPVYDGNGDYVFISYSHSDCEYVYHDIWLMHNLGVNVFYDEGLTAGQIWYEKVEEYIKCDKCRLCIIFLSENILGSDAIRQEMRMISKYKKSFFAIRIGEWAFEKVIGEALTKNIIKFDAVSELSEFFCKDTIYINRDINVNNHQHVQEIVKNLSNYSIDVNTQIVNKQKMSRKILAIYKNSSFSNSIVNGIRENVSKYADIQVDTHIISKDLDKAIANHELCSVLEKERDNYDGFLIRPIEKYDELTRTAIKDIMEHGRKVILLDINMTDEQLETFSTEPSYIGSDFRAGGQIIGERISEITNKFGLAETRILIFGGPFGNQSATLRYSALVKSISTNVNTSNIYNYTLSTLNETSALMEIENYAEEWHYEKSLCEKNVIIYCGNDNIALAVMKVLSRKVSYSKLYKALKDCKKIIIVGYDGIRDVNNEVILKRYGMDFITVDVVPYKQGINAGEQIYSLLFENGNNKQRLTKPELIEYITFPIEKYDNINELAYLFKSKRIIIFDLDGTIADTETFHWRAYNELLSKFGVQLTPEKIRNYIGHSEMSIYDMIKNDYNIDFDNDEFIQNRINIYRKLVKTHNLQPFGFIMDILEEYKNNCVFALVTSQIPEVVNELLENWDIAKFFKPENRFCCHDGKLKKDKIYQNIGEYIKFNDQINYSNILLLEDSEHYMSAAKELGISVIGIEHKYNLNALISCDAILTKNAAKGLFIGLCGLDIIYYSMSELPRNNTKKKISDYTMALGGPATNAAITYSLLGGEAYLLCSIGNSEAGQLIKSLLKKYNVRVIDISSDSDITCNASSIFVNTINGDRTIFSGQTSRGLKLTNRSDVDDIIKKSKFVLYDGNLLGVEGELIKKMEYYKKDFVIDAGSDKEGFGKCFEINPTVISSEGYRDKTGCDVFELHKKYHFLQCAKTRGEKSIQYEEQGQIREIEIQNNCTVDTLGAGDILHGAYCFFRYILQFDFKQALECAGRFATFSVQKKGVVEGIKYAKDNLHQIIY